MNSKAVNAFVFIVCLILFIFELFVFVEHIDYFSTRTLGTANIVALEEQKPKGDFFVSIEYYDGFKKINQSREINISHEFSEGLGINKKTTIYYTKYFDQVLIKGYKNPRILIFLLDLIMLAICYFGMLSGLDGLKKNFQKRVNQQ